MDVGYWSEVITTFTSNMGWFASSLYQNLLIPLALSILALSDWSKLTKSLRAWAYKLLEIALFCLAAVILFCLFAPLFSTMMGRSMTCHVLLLLSITAYAVYCRSMPPSTRIVVASAMFTEINWAFAIAHLIFLLILPLETANLLQFILLLIGLVVICIFRPKPSEKMPVIYWLTMLIIAIVSFVSITTVRIVESDAFGSFGIHSLALRVLLPPFFIVSLLIYYLYYVLSKEHHQAEVMTALQIKQDRDVEFYSRTAALCSELHSLRHELKNHFAVMETMLKEKQYDKLEAYFQDVLGRNTDALDTFYCDNALISSIVNNAISTAGASGIKLDVAAAVPESLPILDSDLCSLLSNLLDNGVEGCLSAGGDIVKASLHTEKGYLFITVINPAPKDLLKENPQLSTTKKFSSGHGYGIPIIRRIAEKYNGCVTFGTENNWFVADVMLCLEDDE